MEDDYIVQKDVVLGTGYNGSVFKAKGRHSDRVYAVKGFHLHGVSADKRADLMAEAEIFLAMDHPHVARLVAVYESTSTLNLVMECMEGGELFERLLEKKRFAERDAAHSVWQMLLAVNYIHSHGVVHRDLKLENFLYETKTNDHLKLIDFGFSKVWEPNTKMRLSCGTLAYVAPEVLCKSYTSQCDLWSLGVICFILILGYMPFAGSEALQVESIKRGQYKKKSPQWENMSHLAREFLEQLLKVDPNERLTAEQALKHPWIADRDQSGRYKITPLARLDSGEFEAGGLNVDTSTIDALCSFAQASKFRRACMSLMAWSLTMEERAMVRDAFIELDVKRQGTIKLYQLKEVLESKFNVEDDQVKRLLESLTAAQDEEIHYSEFLAAMVSTRIAMHDEHLIETFRRFDTTNSGYITQQDLRTVLGETFNKDEMTKLIREVDPSNRGKISYHQFVEYLRSNDASESYSSAACQIIDKAVEQEDDGSRRISRQVDSGNGVTRGVSAQNCGGGPSTRAANCSSGLAPCAEETEKGGRNGARKSKACTIL